MASLLFSPAERADTDPEWLAPVKQAARITRVADITGLDRVGIPVTNAVCPGSNDGLSVYSGKGATLQAARISAIMEAFERTCAAENLPVAMSAGVGDLERSGRPFLRPDQVNRPPHPGLDPGMLVEWSPARPCADPSAPEMLVPTTLAGHYKTRRSAQTFAFTSTNGLASGASVADATVHALYEVIERDDWTMAELVGNRLGLLIARQQGEWSAGARWLNQRFPWIDPTSLPAPADALYERFCRADLQLCLRPITGVTGVPTMIAMCYDPDAVGISARHVGAGTHASPTIAAVRALTEVAQSRAADIAAVREDLSLTGEEVAPHHLHAHRVAAEEESFWDAAPPGFGLDFAAVADAGEVGATVERLAGRMRTAGMGESYVVDLSVGPAAVAGAAACRVITPAAESWAVDRSRLGQRALDCWRAAARQADAAMPPVDGVAERGGVAEQGSAGVLAAVRSEGR